MSMSTEVSTTKAANKKAAKQKGGPKPRKIKVVEETSTGEVVDIAEPAAIDETSKPSRARPERAKKAKADGEPKRLSAIDAAAKVLATGKAPMNCKQMIEAMAATNLWTSPGGKTPHATLYSAILREIKVKGEDARFVKAERGQFAAKAASREAAP
jgi:hypothetical protein